MLLAAGAVQLHPAVGLAQALDPFLELAPRRGAATESVQGRAQQRRAVAAAENALQLAGEVRALGAPRSRGRDRRPIPPRGRSGRRRALRLASRRRASRLARNSTERVASTPKPSSSGANISSAAGPGNDRLLGHRAEHQLGLVGTARSESTVSERSADGDPALVQAQQVIAVGLEALLAARRRGRRAPAARSPRRSRARRDRGCRRGGSEPARRCGPTRRAVEVAEDALEGRLLGAGGSRRVGRRPSAVRLLDAETARRGRARPQRRVDREAGERRRAALGLRRTAR